MKEYKHELTKAYGEFTLGMMSSGKISKTAMPFVKFVNPILDKLDSDNEGLKYLAEQCVKMVEAAKKDKILE